MPCMQFRARLSKQVGQVVAARDKRYDNSSGGTTFDNSK